MNLPNKLTVLRIIMIPMVMVFILLPVEGSWNLFAGAALFLIATLTDFADGAIARKCKKTPYPASYLLGFLKEKKARLLIGADCHNKESIKFGFNEGAELLKAHGINSVTVFESGEYVEKGI